MELRLGRQKAGWMGLRKAAVMECYSVASMDFLKVERKGLLKAVQWDMQMVAWWEQH